MTHEDIAELETRIESRLKTLDIVVKLGWSLIAGAFAIGVWVATIQINVNNHATAIAQQAHETSEEKASIRALEIKDSADTQMLKHIIEKLDRIETKLNP